MKQAKSFTGHVRIKSVSCVNASFHQALHLRDPDTGRIRHLDPETDFRFAVGLKSVERHDNEVSVEFQLKIQHDEAAPQPYDVEVSYLGVFELHGLPEGLTKAEFAERNAAAILFPYVRSAVTSLTARGSAGALFVPPVNVVAMLSRAERHEEGQPHSRGEEITL